MVYGNINLCFDIIIDAVINIDNVNESDRQLIANYKKSIDHHTLTEYLDAVTRLSQCPIIVDALTNKRDRLQLPDNANQFVIHIFSIIYVCVFSFLESLDRILAADYKPDEADILYCRVVTTGVHEISFDYRKRIIRLVNSTKESIVIRFRLIDVGGQKTERRKWIHCFEGVLAILFIISMSSYDQQMDEDEDKVECYALCEWRFYIIESIDR